MIGLLLGSIVFAAAFLIGFLSSVSFPTLVFRSALGFALFYAIGFGIEKLWKKISGGGAEQSGKKHVPENLFKPGKVDFTVGPEFPDEKGENKGENK